jgi:uncharacterized protein YcfL
MKKYFIVLLVACFFFISCKSSQVAVIDNTKPVKNSITTIITGEEKVKIINLKTGKSLTISQDSWEWIVSKVKK